jgi:hypothetical protein
MNKKTCAALLLATLMAASGLIAAPHLAAAVSVPAPSVPEFTVEQVDRSYDVPISSVTTVDPLTGEEKTTYAGGYRIVNLTVDITIRNQPYSPVDLGNGNVVELYYSVRGKGHFSSWEDAYANGDYIYYTPIVASAGEYTVYTVVLKNSPWQIEGTGELDFEVKAVAGYEYNKATSILTWEPRFEVVSESNWSSTQTLTVGIAPTPTYTQLDPENYFPTLNWEHVALAVMATAIAVLIVAVVLLWRRLPKHVA